MNGDQRVKITMSDPRAVPSRLDAALRALANPHRLKILLWLADPEDHFPPQRDGDLVKDGVCVGFLTDKAGLTQPTVTTHLQVLAKAGLVTSKRIKNWVYYKLDRGVIDGVIAELTRAFGQGR